MAQERKDLLKQRFSNRGEQTEKKSSAPKAKAADRGRHSLYLDKALVERVDKAYKDVAHTLYPADLDKATFMEECLAYALDHLDDIQASLAQHNSQVD